jgi:hypothetical protein
VAAGEFGEAARLVGGNDADGVGRLLERAVADGLALSPKSSAVLITSAAITT